MNIIEAYEYLAPKLSISEREVLDVVYKSAGVDKPQLCEVLAEIEEKEISGGDWYYDLVKIKDVKEILSKYFA